VSRSTISDKKNTPKAQHTREIILHAAIEEFAHIGYQQATTAGIAKRAGISKGLIFYHYESKEVLLLAALKYGIDFFERNLFANSEFATTTDIFERIKFIGRMKYDFFKEYYALHAMTLDAYRLADIPEHENIRKYFEETIALKVPKFFEGVDTSRFRNSLSSEEIIAFTIDVMSFVSQRYIQPQIGNYASAEDIAKAFAKAEIYIDLIKHGVYSVET